MKTLNQTRFPRRTAFTLIELLVVIAIIGVLAALIFPALKGAKESGVRRKAQAELKRIETAIDSYKARLGFYPPDNPGFPALNQLFYELQGTVQKGTDLETLDGRERIPAASVATAFGVGVGGFVNSTGAGGADDAKAAEKFLSGLKNDQYGFATPGGVRCGLLVCSVPWPENFGAIISGAPGLNPWRYNSSSPTNNPKAYMLWVNIVIGGKTNRISNWNKEYEITGGVVY